MSKKSIVFYVYNILNPGGTTRSCINMIKNSIENDIFDTIYIVNYQGVKNRDKKIFYENNKLDADKVKFISIKKLRKIREEYDFIITREDFFPISESIKDIKNLRYIIGEVHAPLPYLEDKYLYLENLDFVKVNTKKIYEEFIKKYNYKNVMYNYVSLDHLYKIPEKNIELSKKINLYIVSRLEERQKNISYSIQLIKYIIEQGEQVNLFIDGYGPDEKLYKYLIGEYGLEDSIFINSDNKPENLVPISTSRYETFGFSIIEGIREYGTCLLYPGHDDVLKEIYPETKNVRYLTLNLKKDYKVFQELKKNYDKTLNCYTSKIIEELDDKNYMLNYFGKIDELSLNYNNYDISIASDYYKSLKELNSQKSKLVGLINFLKKILPYKIIGFKTRRKILEFIQRVKKKNEFSNYILDENSYFIETFHGKNFSGNPKALALEIKHENPNSNIYVSSINGLVDIEIRSCGFEPIRFNTNVYKQAYKKSKYIISNGNVLLNLPKLEGQTHVQTWHGLPLKKMVFDLNNKKERKKQIEAFKPRMKKWDYLLTPGGEYTRLLSSAFNINNNKLKIIEKGMPRINYMKKVNQENVKRKYGIELDKKIILFSPTWRKGRRDEVTQLDLIKIVEQLEEYVIILKLHPLEGYIRNQYKDMHSRIIVPLIETSDINDLYAISDILISDYSSVVFDYMHLNKPIIINQEDSEEYNENIGFYFDFETETGLKKGNLNTIEMIETIKNMINKNYEYSSFLNKYTPKDKEYEEGEIIKKIK